MSPQHSNRVELLEGTLRCLELLPPERVTARAIAAESGANLASIGYHFGSKDDLVAAAVVAGLDRWLDEIADGLAELPAGTSTDSFRRAARVIKVSRREHAGVAQNLALALARGHHDTRIRARLVAGFRRARPEVAAVLGFGTDRAGEDAGGLVLSLFVGMLLQVLLDPGLAIDGARLDRACARLAPVLPASRV